MKATPLLALAPLLLAVFAVPAAAQVGSVRQRPLPEKTSVVYGSVERTRLLDQLHGKKTNEIDQLGSVARRAALTQKHYKGEKRVAQRRRSRR
jgi:hypothetical protein